MNNQLIKNILSLVITFLVVFFSVLLGIQHNISSIIIAIADIIILFIVNHLLNIVFKK
ncbi:hypothetical protein [Apilactobacillus xinyiensis]|uniref:hypothetical protein n=1 Tax=Apilactobacillus xinyiensis TaxID=2841032 RepID=UPI001C7E0360|nr:hypothetical protein [Apilactobacillus xinyiensis]